MGNTTGTLNGTLVAQRTLETLLVQFPILSRITSDFGAQGAKFNQTVTTRVVRATTASAYDVNNGYVAIDRAEDDVSVTINKHYHHTYSVNDQERSSTARNLIQDWANTGAYALGAQLVSDLMAVITAAAFTQSFASAAASFDREKLVNIRKAMNKLGIPDLNRFMLLNSDFYAPLALDTTIVANANPGAGNDLLTTGSLPKVHGFDIAEYANLPDNGEKLGGIAGTKDALILVTRLPDVPEDAMIPGNLEVVTEPNTGLSVLLREWYDMKLGKFFRGMTLMYGVGVGYSEANSICKRAVRIITP